MDPCLFKERDIRETYDNSTGEYTCECKLLILDIENLSVNVKETD